MESRCRVTVQRLLQITTPKAMCMQGEVFKSMRNDRYDNVLGLIIKRSAH